MQAQYLIIVYFLARACAVLWCLVLLLCKNIPKLQKLSSALMDWNSSPYKWPTVSVRNNQLEPDSEWTNFERVVPPHQKSTNEPENITYINYWRLTLESNFYMVLLHLTCNKPWFSSRRNWNIDRNLLQCLDPRIIIQVETIAFIGNW